VREGGRECGLAGGEEYIILYIYIALA